MCFSFLSHLQLRLRAQDNGSPQLSSVIPFEVIVRDIDDNPPEFHDPKQVTFQVHEEASGVTVGYVNVSQDKDPDPANQIAFYYLYGEGSDCFQHERNCERN